MRDHTGAGNHDKMFSDEPHDPITGRFHFRWNPKRTSKLIKLTEHNLSIWMSEPDYNFRTALGNLPMNKGIYY